MMQSRKNKIFRPVNQQTVIEDAVLRAIIAKKLKLLRKLEHLSQTELAGLVGCQQAGIARIEKGRVLPSLYTLIRIAKAFNRQLEVKFVENP
jgi:transcriptional regulator with XRE-family HTH domain